MPHGDAAFYELLNRNLRDIGSGIGGRIEESYLKKQLKKEKDEEEAKRKAEEEAKQRLEAEMKGYQVLRPDQFMAPLPEGQTLPEPSEYGRVNIGDVPMELSPKEQEKRDLELKKTRADIAAQEARAEYWENYKGTGGAKRDYSQMTPTELIKAINEISKNVDYYDEDTRVQQENLKQQLMEELYKKQGYAQPAPTPAPVAQPAPGFGAKLAEGTGKFIGGLGRGIKGIMGGGNQQPVMVNSQEEYDALPIGTEYIDSRGNKAIKR